MNGPEPTRPPRTTFTHEQWAALDDDQRALFKDWVQTHHIDPADVPLERPIELDVERNEWLFPVYLRDDQGNRYIDPATDDVAIGHVRRAWWVDPPDLTERSRMARADRIDAAEGPHAD